MMSIEEAFDRIDWKKMMIGGVVALFTFLLLIIGINVFFKSDNRVTLKKEEFEFGVPVAISDQITSIGSEKVYPAMINGNAVNLESSTVYFTEIDPNCLGEQIIQFEQFDLITGKKTRTYRSRVRVIDSVAPEIRLKDLGEIDMDRFSTLTALDIADVEDNYSSAENLKMSLSFSGQAEPGKEVNGLLSVNDENGNTATQNFTLRIMPDPSSETIDKDNTESNVRQEESEDQNIESVPADEQPSIPTPADPVPPAQIPVSTPEPVQKPANRSFLFTDGYDMSNVEGACAAAGDASGYGYACIPIVADNGIYLGMDLVFD